MPSEKIAHPQIVTREAWKSAREALLKEERDFMRARDALNAKRRRLPMVKVEKEYVFQGEHGEVRLIDLFDGKRQLFLQHFMFDPEWEDGCPSCTHMADELSEKQIEHLSDSDTAFAIVSRAPLEKLTQWKKKRGWKHRWVSSLENAFNYDFHVTLDENAAPIEYNFKDKAELEADGFKFEKGVPQELPGWSCFMRIDDGVFHTYSAYARGTEVVGGSHYMLDLTAFGRQQDFEDSPDGWPQKPTYG